MRPMSERLRNLRVGLADLPAKLRKLPAWVFPAVAAVSLLLALVPGLALLKPSDPSSAAVTRGAGSPPLEDSRVDGPSPNSGELLEFAALEPGADRFEEGLVEPWMEPASDGAAGQDSPTLACIIEPDRVVEIRSPVTGLIEAIPVERADVVEKGQVLVKLDSHVEQAAVELARTRAKMDEAVRAGKARLELGRAKSSRLNKLFENGALSLDLREEAETEKELAQLEFDQARKEKQIASLDLRRALAVLDRRTIHSPIAGIVVERSMSPGERVDQETILKVAQIDPLRVEVILPSAMFGSIDTGARATVVPEIPGDTVHVASVTIVDRVVDSASGTFGVRLELPNPDHAIPGGVHCQVRFLDE